MLKKWTMGPVWGGGSVSAAYWKSAVRKKHSPKWSPDWTCCHQPTLEWKCRLSFKSTSVLLILLSCYSFLFYIFNLHLWKKNLDYLLLYIYVTVCSSAPQHGWFHYAEVTRNQPKQKLSTMSGCNQIREHWGHFPQTSADFISLFSHLEQIKPNQTEISKLLAC